MNLLEITMALDCSKYGEDRYSKACEEQGDTLIGVLVILALVGLVVGAILWWWGSRKLKRKQEAQARPPAHDEP